VGRSRLNAGDLMQALARGERLGVVRWSTDTVFERPELKSEPEPAAARSSRYD
jgi:hypothetical protein